MCFFEMKKITLKSENIITILIPLGMLLVNRILYSSGYLIFKCIYYFSNQGYLIKKLDVIQKSILHDMNMKFT
jgi:hypothetical protein